MEMCWEIEAEKIYRREIISISKYLQLKFGLE